MRLAFVTTTVVLLLTSAVVAQTTSRIAAGPVVRVDQVFVEGDASGGTVAAGAVTTVRISKRFSAEAELTQAWNRIERSYEGWFISYVQGPNATREEIERLAPTARRTLRYAPGVGGAAAFVVRGEVNLRVALAGRVGVSARRYTETAAHTILSIPDGVDPARVARDFQNLDYSQDRTRGGLLVGFDVSVAVSERLIVTPEVRFVYRWAGSDWRQTPGAGARRSRHVAVLMAGRAYREADSSARRSVWHRTGDRRGQPGRVAQSVP